jgi:hypothetical protein
MLPVGATQLSPRQHWLVSEHAAPEPMHADPGAQWSAPVLSATQARPQQSASSAQGWPVVWQAAMLWQRGSPRLSAAQLAVPPTGTQQS